MGVAGMSRIVGWDEGALPPPVDQRPSLDRLQLVVMRAEAVEEIEHGEVAPRPVDLVVDLEKGNGGAALSSACRVQPFKGRLL